LLYIENKIGDCFNCSRCSTSPETGGGGGLA